jgi:beta-glucanase (GH16 family)
MHKSSTLVLFAVGIASSMAWRLIWSDEFNGNSIDRNKWHYEIGAGGWGNNELEYYTDRSQNSYIQNGNLVIQANREDYGGAQYTSARMTTQGKFTFNQGRVEARLKLPRGQGVWPAFWLLGENIQQVGWPACGEIDIMEMIGRDPNTIYGTLHAPSFDLGGHYQGGGFADDFHTYAAEWYGDHIDFFVDNNKYTTIWKSQSGGHWPFESNKFFILLNFAVGGNWPGYPDGSAQWPQKFYVDYVRVYQQ